MKDEHFQRCQVATPPDVVALMWRLARERRNGERFPHALDLGAGDARFAHSRDSYEKYTGIEFDKVKAAVAKLPAGATVEVADALVWDKELASLAIGNPPYIRHHHLEPKWRDDAIARLHSKTGVRLKKTANAFVLFLLQALQQTSEDGLVVQLVPFEWVTRPSAKELREFISNQGWSVCVYRFDAEIFPSVLTTASITIIDKRSRESAWAFGVIGADGSLRPISQPSGSTSRVLEYADRDDSLFGLRGLSPGGQDIFVLTEQERLHFCLNRGRDVVACVTSLRHLPADLDVLDAEAFGAYYVDAGRRCWLIRSDREKQSPALVAYLAAVGERWKAYTTCTIRVTWWKYRPHARPALLFSSGFVGKGTKVLVNSVGAVAVGSVYGIIDRGDRDTAAVAKKLRQYDFRRRVVSHSNNLKKVEVRQLNAVLAEFA